MCREFVLHRESRKPAISHSELAQLGRLYHMLFLSMWISIVPVCLFLVSHFKVLCFEIVGYILKNEIGTTCLHAM